MARAKADEIQADAIQTSAADPTVEPDLGHVDTIVEGKDAVDPALAAQTESPVVDANFFAVSIPARERPSFLAWMARQPEGLKARPHTLWLALVEKFRSSKPNP